MADRAVVEVGAGTGLVGENPGKKGQEWSKEKVGARIVCGWLGDAGLQGSRMCHGHSQGH